MPKRSSARLLAAPSWARALLAGEDVLVVDVRTTDEFAAWLLSDFSHQGATVMVAPGWDVICTRCSWPRKL